MSTLSKGRHHGQDSIPPASPESPLDQAAWREQARATLMDLLAAAEDATLPLGKRQLGRLEHTRIITESGRALHTLLDHLPGAPQQ